MFQELPPVEGRVDDQRLFVLLDGRSAHAAGAVEMVLAQIIDRDDVDLVPVRHNLPRIAHHGRPMQTYW